MQSTQDSPPNSSDNDISDEELVADVEKLSFLARMPSNTLVQSKGSDGRRNGQRKESEANDDAPLGDTELKDVEAWEVRPRSRMASSSSEVKATPLPVKSLDGEIIIPRRTTTLNAISTGQGGPEDAIVTAMHVEGVTVQDDLQIMKEQLRKSKELEEKRKQEYQKKIDSENIGLDGVTEKIKEANKILKELNSCASTEQRRNKAKELMAGAAQSLLANPEEQISSQMRALMVFIEQEDPPTSRLAMLSLLAVFKDIIPGYRIKSQEDRERELNGAPISKEVRALWTYENAMLKFYQQYLRRIQDIVKEWRSGKFARAHARVAARCLATLLKTASHFNYAGDILQTLVLNMTSKDGIIRNHCCEAISSLLSRSLYGAAEASGGQLALDSVQLVADLVKRRNCVTPPEVVECLLKLEFTDLLSGEDFEVAKAARKKYRRKKRRENKDEVNRAFKEAQAMVDKDTRRYHQSATLEALFEIFFRVLKTTTKSELVARARQDSSLAPISASKFTKRFPLLSATLDGLGKYCHLISVDYFQDIMMVLEELISSQALPPCIQLRCLLAAANILRGQGEALNVDRREFYINLYASIFTAAIEPLHEMVLEVSSDEERNEKDDEDVNSDMANKISDSSQKVLGELVARLLEMMILDSKLLDVVRQSAFAKRIAGTAAMVGDSGMAMSLLCVLHKMLKRDSKLRNMLENEEGGPVASKAYSPDMNDPAEVGAMAVPLWELALLANHYHPHISQFAIDISTMNSSRQRSSFGHFSGSVLPLSASPLEFISKYTTVHGGFCPAPKVLQAKQNRKHDEKRKQHLGDDESEKIFIQRLDESLKQSPTLLSEICGPGGYDLETGDEMMLANGVVDPMAIETAFRRYFKINAEFELNAALRQKHNIMTQKLQMFHQHLQKK